MGRGTRWARATAGALSVGTGVATAVHSLRFLHAGFYIDTAAVSGSTSGAGLVGTLVVGAIGTLLITGFLSPRSPLLALLCSVSAAVGLSWTCSGRDDLSYLAILADVALLVSFAIVDAALVRLNEVVRSIKWLQRLEPSGALVRPIHVTATAATLEFMFAFWQTTPTLIVWNFADWQQVFNGVYALGILLTVASLIACDAVELFGGRHALESLRAEDTDFVPPVSRKDLSTRILYSHARHPVFLGPFVLLFGSPVMTFDRFLLALAASSFILLHHNLDDVDVAFAADSTKTVISTVRNRRQT